MTTTSQPQARHIDIAAVGHFAAKLRYETDPSDVYAEMLDAAPTLVLVDSRGDAAWSQGRLPGAVHLPTAEVEERAAQLLDPAVPVVTYCWGPGCNGSTRSALALSRLGYEVRELIGGFEYWAREGLPVVTDAGTSRRSVDPLAGPSGSASCDC